jgi:DNA-binding MarR family transcriptional regulator
MSEAQIQTLRRGMQRLFRRFGVLAVDATPCGKPLSMAHAHALMVLLEEGELTQQALGGALCIDKSNVARLCARMVEEDHVVQQPNPHDGRSRYVRLTARGERLAREVEVASHDRFGLLLQGLPQERRGQVLEALALLVHAIENLPERSVS